MSIINKIKNILGFKINTLTDEPGKYDSHFAFEKLVGASENKGYVFMNKTRIQNQGTQGACTGFSASHANNENAYNEWGKEYSKDDLDAWKLRDECLKRGASNTNGWTIQGPLNILRQWGNITGFGIVYELDGVKTALDQGRVLCTGVRGVDWDYVTTKGIAKWTTARSDGHAVCIVGYNDTTRVLICKNSRGPDRGIMGGYYYISYDDFAKLGSIYVLYNANDKEELEKMEYESNLRRAKYLGIWNGLRENDIVSFEEYKIIISRIKNILSKYKLVINYPIYDKITRGIFINIVYKSMKSKLKSISISL